MKQHHHAPHIALPLLLLGILITMLAPALHTRAQQPQGQRIHLPLLANGGAPSAPEDPPPASAPTSDDLIGAALAAGTIDAEAALTYRVFALFADERLPAQFRAAEPGHGLEQAVSQLPRLLPGLSPAAQAALDPFTLPPYHAGSWWDLRNSDSQGARLAERRCGQTDGTSDTSALESWHYVDGANSPVRIWWQADKPADGDVAAAMVAEVDTIWLSLKALMGRTPPLDGGSIRPCRGGDDRIDVSLALPTADYPAFAYPYDSRGAASSSYIVIGRGKNTAMLVHELMHSFQFAFPSASKGVDEAWWMEATAKWAEHYYESTTSGSDTNGEHNSAQSFLAVPHKALENEDGSHEYGAYLLPLFIQMRSGSVGFVRTSFERLGGEPDSLVVVNSLLDGGFAGLWGEFVFANMNQRPFDEYYRYDRLSARAAPTEEHLVYLGGNSQRSYALDGQVPHLAAHVAKFTFSSLDASGRTVFFTNPYAGGEWPTARVQALFRTEGSTTFQRADWTDQPAPSLCRDLRGERVEELYIIVSNHEHRNRAHKLQPSEAPTLTASNVACRGWQGTVRYEDYYTDGDEDLGAILAHQEVEITTAVTFERKPTPAWLGEAVPLYFEPRSGTTPVVHLSGWSYNADDGVSKCFYDQQTAGAIETLRSRLFILMVNGAPAYAAEGELKDHTIGGTDSCGHESELTITSDWFLTEASAGDMGSLSQFVSADGKLIQGAYRVDDDDTDWTFIRYSWELEALPPEP
jgi:hypothetical protein